MPLPVDPVGRALVQLIARDRYERWLIDQVHGVLTAGFNDIVATLLTTYADLTPAQQARKARLFSQIAGQLSATYGRADTLMSGQMKDFAGIEVKAHTQQLRDLVADSPIADVTLGNLTRAEVKAIAEFPIAGLNLGEWFDKQALDMNVAMRGQIQLGLLNGEPSRTIAQRLIPQTPTAETPGIVDRSRRATLALVRTTVTTVQTQASYDTLQSIGDNYMPAFRYVAVRDARTTPICRALDGKVYRFDDPKAKRPPQHVNCRSTIVGVPDYKKLGLAEPNTVAGGFTMGSYAGWLKTQPPGQQDAILGRAGAALFRRGDATLSDLINSDGARLTTKALADTYQGKATASVRVRPPAPTPPARSADTPPAYVVAKEDVIRRGAKEHGTAWAADGTVIVDKKGSAHRVPITADESRAMLNADTFTHNHPNGGPLSAGDFGFALSHNIREFRAVGIEPGTGRVVDYAMVRKVVDPAITRPQPVRFGPASLKRVYDQSMLRLAVQKQSPTYGGIVSDAQRAEHSRIWFDTMHERLAEFHQRDGRFTYTRTYRT